MSSETRWHTDFISLVNYSPDLIAKINKELEVVFVNDAICHFLDKPKDYFIGRSFPAIYGSVIPEIVGMEKEAVYFLERVKESFQTGKAFCYENEGWYDSMKKYEFHFVPLETKDGQTQHLLCIIKNVTDVKRKEEELRKTIKEMEVLSDHLIYQNKVLQDFAYITSHNLRSPIANFRALLQIYEFYESESEKKDVFEKIKNATEALNKTINELTDTISIKGSLKKELERLDFKQQLEEVKESLWMDVQEAVSGCTTNFEQAPDILYPKIYLQSIFLNLLTNSIKYRSHNRPLKLHVETHKKDGKIVLVWKDNGIGIDMEKHGNQLFGLKSTFHDREDSRGIGLYITRNQIESVGGTISAESEVDKGATFTITFKDLRVV